MSGWFGSSKVKAPDYTPPPPEVPPAGAEDDKVSELKKRKRGHMANLMTGGMGLSEISSENLSRVYLGGKSSTGIKTDA